jgi:hypothetical protein
MRYLILIISCVISANCFGQQNYVVQLGDSTYDVSLDSSYQITIAGKKINLSLKQKNILTLEDTLFSLSYLSGFQVTKSAIDPKVDQYLILTADATGFILQAFRTINPTGLNETMLRETTKQNISYGYSMQRQDTSRTLKSGQIIPVNKATLTFKDTKYVVEVASIGSRDEGIMIITIDSGLDYTGKGKELIRLLWESLRYNK